MRPRAMPFHASRTLITGAIELVVQEAAETMGRHSFSKSSFTPRTIIVTSSFGGAVIRTAFAPALRCISHLSRLRNLPEDSITKSTFSSFHGHFAGSPSFTPLTHLPFTFI